MSTEQQTAAADADALSKATEELIETVPLMQQTAPPPKADDAPATQQSDDPADVELREALAALEAEKNPKSADTTQTQAATEPPKEITEAIPPVANKEADKTPVMIPKARLDEVLKERDEAKATASYFKGVVDARKEMAQAPAPAQTQTQTEPVKTIPELLNDINALKLDYAKKYDEGEMTATEWMSRNIELDNQAATIRSEASKIENERLRKDAVAEARREAMAESLVEHASQQDVAHPSLLEVKSEDHWAFLRSEAARTLSEQGIKLVADDTRSTKIFREQIARLADVYVPIWTGKPLPQTVQTTSQGAPQQTQKSGKTTTIAEQRMAKINLSHQQPPDSGNLGSTGVKTELTDAQISRMSDDEIAGLPDATRARVKGIAA